MHFIFEYSFLLLRYLFGYQHCQAFGFVKSVREPEDIVFALGLIDVVP